METVLLKNISENDLRHRLNQGHIILYPTDTVYGLGCDATNTEAVQRIREMKQSDQPFSVIAPSLEWIRKHCTAPESFLQKFPGPITLILTKKDPSFLAACAPDSLGVRIPKHLLTPLLQNIGPIVTTSANIHGQPTLTSVQKLPKTLTPDLVIDGGTLASEPSEIWDCTGNPCKIR